jgi:uncharacterized membrane protein
MPRAWNRTLTRLMLALALTCAVGWQFKAHCTVGGWTDAEQYTTGCYTDAIPFWDGRGVSAGQVPYFEARLEYPVLTGALIWVDGTITRTLFGANANAAHFLRVVALLNALLAGLILWLLWRAGMDERRLWAWALAPPLILYVGHNWDLLAVAFAVLALLRARAGAPVQSSALAGLGLAAKLYPALLLPLLGLQALFAGTGNWVKRILLGASIGVAFVAAYLVVNAPVAAFAWDNWLEFYRFSSERGGTAAATWDILNRSGFATTIPQRNFYALILFAIGAGAITWLGWARHRNRLWVLFTPVLAWFMLTNKVYSPQFDLWLYPVLLMTAPRLRPVALFVAAGIAAYFAEFWYFAATEGQHPAATLWDVSFFAAIRGAAMLWIIADAVRLDPPEWLVPKPAGSG